MYILCLDCFKMVKDEKIILPTPPTDEEKLQYLKLNKFMFYGLGFLSYICLNVGIFLLLRTNVKYLVLLPYALYEFFYLGSSYLIGAFGKEFDFNQHKHILEDSKSLEYQPSIDVYLPCCGEPLEILNNTYTYVKRIEYSNLRVHVLDDGDKIEVKELAFKYGFNYIARDNRPHLKKAGNLRYAFQRTSADLFLILDADFCPRHDIFKETIPYFYHNKKLAILQTPQFFRVRHEQTWVEKGI